LLVSDIMQQAFSQVGANLYKCSGGIKKKLEYISQSGDNVMDVFRHVQGKMIYDNLQCCDEESINVIGYNFMEDEYFIYDMFKQDMKKYNIEKKYPQCNILILSQYKRDILEKMICKKEVGIGTLNTETNT